MDQRRVEPLFGEDLKFVFVVATGIWLEEKKLSPHIVDNLRQQTISILCANSGNIYSTIA